MDPSPRDYQIKHVRKNRISDVINGLTFCHVEEPRASDLCQDGWLAMDSPLDRDPTATVKSGFSLSSGESGASDSNPMA